MKSLIFILLFLFIFKGIFWAGLIPLWQAPDEPNHFANIQFVAETEKPFVTRSDKNLSKEIAQSTNLLNLDLDLNLKGNASPPRWLPDFSKSSEGKFEQEIINIPKEYRKDFIAVVGGVKNPPFYYVLTGLIYRIFYPLSLLDRVFFIRMSSVALGVGIIWMSFAIAKEIFSNNNTKAIVVAALVSFHPTFNIVSSTINPDVLLIFLTSVFLYFGVRILKNNEFNFKNLFFFYAAQALAVLTRFAGLSLIPASGLVLLLRKQYLIMTFVFLVLAVLSVVLRSPGLLEEFSQFFTNPTNFSPTSFLNFAVNSFSHYNGEVFPWYWAVFGWLEASLPITAYRLLRIVTIFSFLGLLIAIFLWLKKPTLDSNFKIWLFLLVTILFTIGVILLFDWQTYARTGTGFGVQGRHLLYSISAQMTFLVAGAVIFFKKLRIAEKFTLLCLVLIFISLNFLSIWIMVSFFYQTTNFSELILRVSQYKPEFFKNIWIIFWFFVFLIFQLIFTIKFLIEVAKSRE